MKIVILAGGTGSIALQTGLYEMLDSITDGIETKILVNSYDNGLSTGMVRKVCDGKILGPSDVRKNQTTRLKLENPESPWNKFLDIRFTCESSKVLQFCLNAVNNLSVDLNVLNDSRDMIVLVKAIEAFLNIPVALKIDYTDFSLANIIYAGLAKLNNNSLRAAASIMANLMGIKDNVILNDDTSLFLGAITKNGIRVTDEGDIVSWGNINDPFVDVFFTDSDGNQKNPVLCDEAAIALLEADLIILSSGTQWSSLIPTYASERFERIIYNSTAKILMVMNRQPDKDSPGQTASDIIKMIVPRYFGEGRINLIIDKGGHEQMSQVDDQSTKLLASVTYFTSTGTTSKHHPHDLFKAIANSYFKDYLDSEHFMFDYDDTLVGRGNYQQKSSELNKKMLCDLKNTSSTSVCTGNNIKAVSLRVENSFSKPLPLTVFADGGVNEYSYSTLHENDSDDGFKPEFVKCVHPSCLIDADLIQRITTVLKENGIQYSKIENRGNAMICIKPIHEEYRAIAINLIQRILLSMKGYDLSISKNLIVKAAGRTTIEIHHADLSKLHAVKHVLNSGIKYITYVGDELENGNDLVIKQMNDNRIKCLHVKDPAETAFFLQSLLHHQNNINYR